MSLIPSEFAPVPTQMNSQMGKSISVLFLLFIFLFSLFKENTDLLCQFPYMSEQSTEHVMNMDDRVKRKGLVTVQHVKEAVTAPRDPGSCVHHQKASGFCPRNLQVGCLAQW